MKQTLLSVFLFTVILPAESYIHLDCRLHVDQKAFLLGTNTTLANNSNQVFNRSTCVGFVHVTVLKLSLPAFCNEPETFLTIKNEQVSVRLVANVSRLPNASQNLSFCLTETILKDFSDNLPGNLTFVFEVTPRESGIDGCSKGCGTTSSYVTLANPPQPKLQITGVARSNFFKPYLLTEDVLTMIPTKAPDSATDGEQCVDVELKLVNSNNVYNASLLQAAEKTTLDLKLSTVNIFLLVNGNAWLKETKVYREASFYPSKNGLIPGLDDIGKPTTSHASVNKTKLVSALCFSSVLELYYKAFQWTDVSVDVYEVQVWYTYHAEHSVSETAGKKSMKKFTVVWNALLQQSKEVQKPCKASSALHQAPLIVFYVMHVFLIPLNIIAWSRYIWYQHYVKKQEEFCKYFAHKVRRGLLRTPTVEALRTLSQQAETSFSRRPKCLLPGTNVDLQDVAVIFCSDVSEREKLIRMLDEIPEFLKFWRNMVQLMVKRIHFFRSTAAATSKKSSKRK